MVEEIQSRLERVRQAVATLPQEKRVTVFYEVYDEPLMTVGRDWPAIRDGLWHQRLCRPGGTLSAGQF